MDEKSIKENMEGFTKPELLKIFPSLEIKDSEKKSFVIESVLTGEPTDKEKADFMGKVAEKAISEKADSEAVNEKSNRSILTKEELSRFGQGVLIAMFPSLQLRGTVSAIIAKILNGYPTAKEVEGFEIALKKRKQEDKEAGTNSKYITVHAVNEDGRKHKPGDPYIGKNATKLLKSGQLRKKGE